MVLLSVSAQAQLMAGLRTGWATQQQGAFISPSIGYKANSFFVNAELVTNLKWDAPVQAGLKLSYQYRFAEIGSGIMYEAYTTDKYDWWKNGLVVPVFAALHYKIMYVQYEYQFGGNVISNEQRISAGIRIKI